MSRNQAFPGTRKRDGGMDLSLEDGTVFRAAGGGGGAGAGQVFGEKVSSKTSFGGPALESKKTHKVLCDGLGHVG